MNIISFIVGLVLLFFGRRLFWFFVAAAGFAAGMFLARDYFHLDSEMLVLAIGLLAGVIGAILGILLQKLAIAVAGFAAGGYLGAVLIEALNAPNFVWIGFIVGGVLGAILLLVVFEWTLIGLSALVGASLVSDAFSEQTNGMVFLVALVVGVVAQALQMRHVRAVESRASAAPPPAG